MKKYLLKQHVHYCRVDDGVIFLDLKHCKYIGIGVDHAHLLSSLVHGWPKSSWQAAPSCLVDAAEANTMVTSLLSADLLTTEAQLGREPLETVIESTDDLPFEGKLGSESAPTARQVLRFVYSCAVAATMLRFLSMERIVARVAAKKRQPACRPETDARKLVKIFRLLTPFLFSAKSACLFESLALFEFLSAHGVFTTWVVGVRTRPFGAHSWLQQGNLVLTDTVDRARDFTPLMAI